MLKNIICVVGLSVSLFASGEVMSPSTLVDHEDGYYLSPTNPLLTADQREIEDRAIKLMTRPEIVSARNQVSRQWRAAVGDHPGEKAWALFEGMLDEYVYIHLLKSVNGDPNYPKLSSMTWAPPHNWFGKDVPGSRAGGPNPDNNYRDAPIDPNGHYEISGQLLEPEVFDFGISVMSNDFYTLKLPILEKRDIQFSKDGSFVVTIGPEPADGRRNHLQTTPDTKLVFIRDTRTDWSQKPNAIRIKRVDSPSAQHMTDDQVVDLAIRKMWIDVPYAYWWMRISLAQPPNQMTNPTNTGDVGGLVTQATSFGRAELKDDEAMVITVSSGGAGYHALSVYDYWYRNLDPAKYLASFNNAQAAVNPDGTLTFVLTAKDPGVYNWLDTAGQDQLLLIYRWQNLPLDNVAPQPLTMDARLVKVSDLEKVLPDGIKRITPAQRQQQQEERRAQYLSRYQ